MTLAFYVGMMHHTDPKKYPKSPRELWEERGDMTLDQWKAFALSVAENAHEHRD